MSFNNDTGASARSDPALARLLSGDPAKLTNFEKERVLRGVFSALQTGAAPTRRARSPWFSRVGAVLAIAAAASLFMVMMPSRQDDGLAPRGEDAHTFRIRCTPPSEGSCRQTDTLLFELEVAPLPYFAAVAKGPGGDLFWYVPANTDAQSIATEGHMRRGLLDLGVPLAEAHQPGLYDVFGILSVRPLTRTEIRERIATGVSDRDVIVKRRALTIVAGEER